MWLYELFYKKGKKVVPQNIYDLITPFSLAILIADDGCYTNSGVRISVNSFTLAEVELLALTLKKKFNLDCTIQDVYLKNPEYSASDGCYESAGTTSVIGLKKYIKKDKYSIYIKKNSLLILRNLVYLHMPKSMLYKLGL